MSKTAMYTELRKRYNELVPALPTEFANESFDKPEGFMWARFTVIFGKEMQLDIGAEKKTFRTPGQVIVQIFAPSQTGSIDALEQSDVLADGFRNWTGAMIRCREASAREVGTDPYGWYQINVEITFQADVLH